MVSAPKTFIERLVPFEYNAGQFINVHLKLECNSLIHKFPEKQSEKSQPTVLQHKRLTLF